MNVRPAGREAAEMFVRQHYPECRVALLAGSVAAGRETSTSDLDLVILDDSVERPFRESYEEMGWPIEAFVVTTDTVRDFLEIAQYKALPTLARMCVEGIVIKDDGSAEAVIDAAKESLRNGPTPWDEDEQEQARYEISEYLEDLAGSQSVEEDWFIFQRFTLRMAEFVLRTRCCWAGEGKWLLRSLQACDGDLAQEMLGSMRDFYHHGQKRGIIELGDRLLKPYGGRLMAGYRQEG